MEVEKVIEKINKFLDKEKFKTQDKYFIAKKLEMDYLNEILEIEEEEDLIEEESDELDTEEEIVDEEPEDEVAAEEEDELDLDDLDEAPKKPLIKRPKLKKKK